MVTITLALEVSRIGYFVSKGKDSMGGISDDLGEVFRAAF